MIRIVEENKRFYIYSEELGKYFHCCYSEEDFANRVLEIIRKKYNAFKLERTFGSKKDVIQL